MIDNFIAILNGVKHKSGDIISGNKKLKDTINELEDIYRVFKRQIDKIASGVSNIKFKHLESIRQKTNSKLRSYR